MASGRVNGRNGGVDFSELLKLQAAFKDLSDNAKVEINEAIVKEQAAAVLSSAVRLTPVGQYNDGTVGGTLRRGWLVRTEQEAQTGDSSIPGQQEIKRVVDGLKVTRRGKNYSLELRNNVNYASFVNYGHRTRGGAGFVAGQFFLEKALQNAGKNSRRRLERVLIRELKERLDDFN